MDHVHLDDTKENNQVTEATDDSLNTIYDYIMKTEASNAIKP